MSRPTLIAASFAATLLTAHLLTRPFLPPTAEWAERKGLIQHRAARVLNHEQQYSDIEVIGDSLSACIFRGLHTELNVKVQNGAYGSYHIGDEFAVAVDAADAGVKLALIELNPLLWNLPARYFSEKRTGEQIVGDGMNGEVIFPHLDDALRRRWLTQLGVEGLLERLAMRFALLRIRESKLTRQWVNPLSTFFFGKPVPEPAPDVAEQCRHFETAPLEGVDLDVLERFLGWLRADGRMSAIFFFPPINREFLAACGGPALQNVKSLMSRLDRRLREKEFAVWDLTEKLATDRFTDFGHVHRIDTDCKELAAEWHHALVESGTLARR